MIKKLPYIIVVFFLLYLVAGCRSEIRPCDDLNLSSFEEFIGLNKNTNEVELKTVFGKSTNGEYTDDKLTFIYEFNSIERVPVSVYVDAESGKLETVFIEILGFEDAFRTDVKAAQSKYPISECHANLFGKNPNELLSLFGEAKSDEAKLDSFGREVRTIVYDKPEENIMISFSFYPSQENKLSSIIVDWF